jgi:hypothetical protein
MGHPTAEALKDLRFYHRISNKQRNLVEHCFNRLAHSSDREDNTADQFEVLGY